MRVVRPDGLVSIEKDKFEIDGSRAMTVDPLSANLKMGINTIWSLTVEIPYDLKKYPDINNIIFEESIFIVDIGNNAYEASQYQLFRVYYVDRTPESIVCDCNPIFIDCDSIMIQDTRAEDKTASEALQILFNGTGYTIDAEITTEKSTAYWVWLTTISALNGDNENSFVNRWGGEFYFDNYNLIWRKYIDRFRNSDDSDLIKIKAGFNMTGIQYTVDTTKLVTEIWPQSYNGHHYQENGKYIGIKSPNYDKYTKSYPKIITYDNVKLKEDASDEENDDIIVCNTYDELYKTLKQLSELEYLVNEVDIPTITYKVDFIDLAGTDKYKGYEDLVKLYLGDSVLVYNEDLNIKTRARITEIDYDCVNKLVTGMTLGDYEIDYLKEQISQSRVLTEVINTSKTGVNGESIFGVQNGNNTQIQVSKDSDNTGDIKVLKFEDTSKSSSHYGAISFGTQGLLATKTRLKDNSGWDWSKSILVNEKGTWYGKVGNEKGSKYIKFDENGLQSYDSGVSGKGITGTFVGDSFHVTNGIVTGQTQWKPITYELSVNDNMLTLADSNGNAQTVKIPETKTIITGDKGEKGDPGAKGDPGRAGTVTVGTVTTGSAGTNAIVTNSGTSNDAIINFQIPKGDKGDSLTIKDYAVEYQEGTSSIEAPIGAWMTKPMDILQGNYLWTRITLNFSDGATTQYYSVARQGIDGIKGATGKTGDTGKGVKSVTHYYLATGLNTSVTRDSDGWTTGIQLTDSTKKYLWTYEETTWTDSSKTYTDPVIIGTYGEKGDKGMSSFLHIAYANSNDGQIGFSHTWSKSKTWIGHYITDTNEADSDDPSKYTWVKWVGDDGIGIQEIIEYYNVSASNTDIPTTWSTTVQALDSVNRYLWNYEEIKFSSGESHKSTPRVIGVYSNSITKITPYYYLSNSRDTFTLVSGHSWTTTIPNISDGEYLWEKMIVTFDNGSTKETEPVLHGEYNALSEGMNIISSNVDSQIDNAQDHILQQVYSTYATKDALNEYKASMNTQFGIYDGKISANISELNSVKSNVAGLTETANNVNNYMTFDKNGLSLGKSDSDFKTNITNEKLAFLQNGNEVAYFANNQMYVTDGNFANSMTIGKFAFAPRANGSLDFKKVGK